MEIAVLSDIHANLEAFLKILGDIDLRGIQKIISIGDNIGYGPNPEAVMQLLLARGIYSTLGNHEMPVKQKSFINWFNPVAQKSVHYTLSRLSEKSIAAIKIFQPFFIYQGARFVHGVPKKSVTIYIFQLSEAMLKKKFRDMDERVCFIGHTHDLGLITYDGLGFERSSLTEGVTRLDKEKKYIINIGSVGQPRDGDNRAKYVIWDTDAGTVELKCLAYDYKKTCEKIRAAELPEQYASRLSAKF